MKKRTLNKIRPLLVGITCLAATASAQAVPVLFNGHFYEHIATTSTWTDARAAALASTHLGQSGYLATVTSAAENAFLLTLASDGWLGGTDEITEGTWLWADGPEAGVNFWNGGAGGSSPTFANWGGGEPNNLGGEDYLHLSGGTWNDLPNINLGAGYFVEYNAVSEPTSVLLLGFGLLGLALRGRTRSKAQA